MTDAEQDQPSGLARAVAYQGAIRKRLRSNDDIHVAVAWARDEISLGQASVGFGLEPAATGKTYVRLALAIRDGIRTNQVKLSDA